MRLQPEQTKRIIECIAEEMGVELGDTITIGNGFYVVIDAEGFKSNNGLIAPAWIWHTIIRGWESFEKVPWEPKMLEEYFFPHFTSDKGWSNSLWCDDNVDHRTKKTVGIYRTREEAIQKARELGWAE